MSRSMNRHRRVKFSGLSQPGTLDGSHPLLRSLLSALLVALLVLLPVGWFSFKHYAAPSKLAKSALVGRRSPTALNVVLALDESGSFVNYSSMRADAIDQLYKWAPKNLRDDDTITVIGWAKNATVTSPCSSVETIASASAKTGGGKVDSRETNFVPALQEAQGAIEGEGRPTTLIVVTDTVAGDLANQAKIDKLIEKMNVTSMSVILPQGKRIYGDWQRAFPWEETFHARSDKPNQIAVAIGKSLAHATGQRLQRS
ncbi:hypothetical protein OZX67_02180 [Bifidobacterium sp. ESL0728]|uniref:VWA domain-containing protein n=1 Tax=Bifidobacterium sp. ESL0728 TaxID=2983220 RepID=UPI0023F79E16|nr:VWA domain-containing protein [Bifidobacterium sp. ESL0728]WEV59393.1 hypothetical protein OZX67_02180 [Bifidobacterium sp. ESL0728]